MSLSEITYETGYSSIAHISAQFKKITGLTPSQFRERRLERLKAIDNV